MYAFTKVISEFINDQFILFDSYLYTRYLCTLGLSLSDYQPLEQARVTIGYIVYKILIGTKNLRAVTIL